MEKTLWKHVRSVRDQSPLVHNITNYVVMNTTANALLAVGASPVMAHAQAEVKEMVSIAGSVLINIGTLDEYGSESMLLAAEAAHVLGKPWVLDPVGAGATPFRDRLLKKLVQFRPAVIRGNASEILAMAKANTSVTKGVDSTASSLDAVTAARSLVDQYQSVVCISGETDITVDHEGSTVLTRNGHPLMTKVTGLGCTASALIAAFTAVTEDKTGAAVAAMALLGVAGELARKQSAGPGSLQMNIIDKLYTITEAEFLSQVKVSVQ